MSMQRRIRLWRLAVERAQGQPVQVSHVCAAALSAAFADGAAVTVTASANSRETVYASDVHTSEVEELMWTLGEGPGADALSSALVLVPDLSTQESLMRWPIFAPAATQAGIRAVYALPLQVGGIRLGVMSLYRARPGELGEERLADGLVLADTVCALLLDAAQHPREPEPVGSQHPEVHQATGMIIAQLGVTALVALSRLRGYAYANDRRLRDVARDVVARRLRFERD